MRKKKVLPLIGVLVLCICTCVVLMIGFSGKKDEPETVPETDQPTQETEAFELDMVPWVRIDADALFDDTYWRWVVGPTGGSVLAVQFHPDGIVEYCRMTSPQIELARYECDGQLLTFNGISYWWDGEYFQSTLKHDAPMEPEGTYYTIGPDPEQNWCQHLVEAQLAREGFCDEYQQALDITKKLVRVVGQQGTRVWEYEFQYDENGLLTQVTETRDAAQDPYAVTTLSYDDNHRLTGRQVTCGNVRNTSVEYRYDANGALISSAYQREEEGGCEVAYGYDLLGYPEQIKVMYDMALQEYSFGFDDSGQMRWYRTYFTDADTEATSSELTGANSCGMTYRYKPFLTLTDGTMFLLDEYGNGNALAMDAGTVLYGFEFQYPRRICDEDGYVTKIMDGEVIFDLYYE